MAAATRYEFSHCRVRVIQPGQEVESEKRTIVCTEEELGLMQEWEDRVNKRFRARFCPNGSIIQVERENAVELFRDMLLYWHAVYERDTTGMVLDLSKPLDALLQFKMKKIFHEENKLYTRVQEHGISMDDIDLKSHFKRIDNDPEQRINQEVESSVDAEIDRDIEDDLQDQLQTQDIH